MPEQGEVHPLDEAMETQERHRTGSRTPAGLGSGQRPGERAGLRGRLREEGRHRGNDLEGREDLRRAQVQVRGPGEDAAASPVERRGAELPTGGRVADGNAKGDHQTFPLRQVGRSSCCRLMDSPAVTKVRESPDLTTGCGEQARWPVVRSSTCGCVGRRASAESMASGW